MTGPVPETADPGAATTPATPVRRTKRRDSWPLRTRLIAELVGLLALLCLVIGVVTEFALQNFLVGQLDNQLISASNRGKQYSNHGPRDLPELPNQGEPPEFLVAPGQGPQTLGARLVDGEVVQAAVLNDKGRTESIPAAGLDVLGSLPSDGEPRTRDLGVLGDYRLVATAMPNGDVMVTGLPLSGVYDTLLQLGLILGGVAVAGLLAAGVAGASLIRGTLRPLNRVAETAARVAELPLHRGEVALPDRVPDVDTNPRTEVGKVGAALNRMLGHVANALAARQASESRVRRFVADASHELRTPLAAIRGYAELTRRSRDEVPPEIAYAMSRVESESARMTTLVEELLLLARLDSGRQVTREPVDLSLLVATAVNDAHVAGKEHHWRLELPAEPIEVIGDGAQLHQVVTNLLTNARTHTAPGTTVVTSLFTKDRRVVLTVDDDGGGIPAELLPDIFERFARGDTSRSRAAGSTGLGLAIVSAVVVAHHGTIDVDSGPGRTVFTVTLPLPERSREKGTAGAQQGHT